MNVPFTDGRERRLKAYPVLADEIWVLVYGGIATGVMASLTVAAVVAALSLGEISLGIVGLIGVVGVAATAGALRDIIDNIKRETTVGDD